MRPSRTTSRLHRAVPQLAFVGFAAGVYAAAIAIVRELPHLEPRADPVAIALTLDLVVVIPIAFYALVARRLGWPIVSLAPVFILSLLAAYRILPADQQQSLRVLEALAVPIELSLLSWIGWRAAKAIRYARSDAGGDPLQRIRYAALEVTHNHRAAAILATEVAVLYAAIASWGARPHAPHGTVAFTHHQRGGLAGIVLGFILAMAIEGLAVHLLLQHWSTLAAWIFTIANVYGMLWLLADYRLTVLRPILVSDDSVVVRAGLRFTVRVPLDKLTEVTRVKPDFGKESVNVTFLGTPTHWLTLTESIEAEGPYGFKRRVRAIGLEPDAADDFERVLNARRAPA